MGIDKMMHFSHVPFNVNEEVKVKLTEKGLKHLASIGSLNCEFKLQDDGYHKVQLWVLMRDLGPLCGNGFDNAFETNILLIDVEVDR
jgi:hypothetical protein